MQISRECKAFVKDQGDTVVAVTWGMDDLPANAQARKEFSAVFASSRLRLSFSLIS